MPTSPTDRELRRTRRVERRALARARRPLSGWLWLIAVTIIPAYALLAGAVALAFHVQGNDRNDRDAADRKIAIEVAVRGCNDRNATKAAVRELITTAIEGGDQSFDLTRVPGFDNLDPATQAFFRNLADMTSDGSGSAVNDRLIAFRASLIDEDCDGLARQIEQDLAAKQ